MYNSGSVALVVTGTVAVTLNAIVLGTISGGDLLLKKVSEFQKKNKKCSNLFTQRIKNI